MTIPRIVRLSVTMRQLRFERRSVCETRKTLFAAENFPFCASLGRNRICFSSYCSSSCLHDHASNEQQPRFRHFSSLADPTTRKRNTGDVDENLIQWQLEKLVLEGSIEDDYHQRRAAVELDRLRNDLLTKSPSEGMSAVEMANLARSSSKSPSVISGWLGSIFSGGNGVSDDLEKSANRSDVTTGAYLFGGPGCGR